MITATSCIFPFSRSRTDDIKSLILDSIRELCVVDHGNNEVTIEDWYRNAVNAFWSESRHRIWTYDGKLLLGIAGCDNEARIQALYVAPAGVGMGVGAALLAGMERHIKAGGYPCALVNSSMTGRNFYMKHGYYSLGTPQIGAGRSWNFPMKRWF